MITKKKIDTINTGSLRELVNRINDLEIQKEDIVQVFQVASTKPTIKLIPYFQTKIVAGTDW